MEIFSWLMGGPLGRAAAYSFNGPARFFFKEGLVKKPSKEVLAMYLAPFRRRRDRKQTSISPRPIIAFTLRANSFQLPELISPSHAYVT